MTTPCTGGYLPRAGESLEAEVARLLEGPGIAFYSSCANGCGQALNGACRYCGACPCMGRHGAYCAAVAPAEKQPEQPEQSEQPEEGEHAVSEDTGEGA